VAKKRKQEKPRELTHRQLSSHKKQARRQRIILTTGIVIIAAAIILPLVGWFTAEYLPLHKTMLQINSVKYNMEYYIDTMILMRMDQPTTDTSTLANNALQTIMQDQLIKEGAASLNITISESEIKASLKSSGLPQKRSYVDFFMGQSLVQKMETDYFTGLLPATDNQTHALMMMLEDSQQAAQIRQQIVNGGNFTALSKEYAQNYYSKNINYGDFGMHVRAVLKDEVGSDFPLDYAFSAAAGDLSQPISDNETYKQSGYWLFKITERPEEGKVGVQALLLSDNTTATDIKAKLEAGKVSLSDMADQYSQFSLSKEKHGDIGVISLSDNATYTQTFNSYVFNADSPIGVWSQPINETELWTQGGAWIVKVLERQDNVPPSAEDKSYLLNQEVNNWYSDLVNNPNNKVNSELLTTEMQTWAMARVDKELPAQQTQTP
jgi:parvulin-like peptidyl-prolyl isomerase